MVSQMFNDGIKYDELKGSKEIRKIVKEININR